VTARVIVDILIVSYNGRDELAACLASLDRFPPSSSGLRTRVRVLDNASTDGSPEMVATRFPGVALERSDCNVGFAPANNRLVATSDADYVLLLNPDTVLTEDVISPLRAVLDSDPRIAVAGPRLVSPDGTQQPSGDRLPTLRYELARNLHGTKAESLLRPLIDLPATLAASRQLHLQDARAPRAVEFLWATCWLARTADARRYGPFDEYFTTYEEDVDLCRRLADDGRIAMYVPSVSLVHVGGASSDPERKRRLMHEGRGRYYRRHGGLPAALTYRAITQSVDGAKRLARSCRRG
jgi:N-acetylglucosaminyl-diphospho-decaprenol L-rhamnosyltransferase